MVHVPFQRLHRSSLLVRFALSSFNALVACSLAQPSLCYHPLTNRPLPSSIVMSCLVSTLSFKDRSGVLSCTTNKKTSYILLVDWLCIGIGQIKFRNKFVQYLYCCWTIEYLNDAIYIERTLAWGIMLDKWIALINVPCNPIRKSQKSWV